MDYLEWKVKRQFLSGNIEATKVRDRSHEFIVVVFHLLSFNVFTYVYKEPFEGKTSYFTSGSIPSYILSQS